MKREQQPEIGMITTSETWSKRTNQCFQIHRKSVGDSLQPVQRAIRIGTRTVGKCKNSKGKMTIPKPISLFDVSKCFFYLFDLNRKVRLTFYKKLDQLLRLEDALKVHSQGSCPLCPLLRADHSFFVQAINPVLNSWFRMAPFPAITGRKNAMPTDLCPVSLMS